MLMKTAEFSSFKVKFGNLRTHQVISTKVISLPFRRAGSHGVIHSVPCEFSSRLGSSMAAKFEHCLEKFEHCLEKFEHCLEKFEHCLGRAS